MEQATVKLTLNQPTYVELAILDYSKTMMYDFHYNYIKQKKTDSTLLFTDTNSLISQVQTVNVYKVDKLLFDFSGYKKESLFYTDENKTVIGEMKDDLNGGIVKEFADLRTQMHSLKTKKEEIKKVKGVKKNAVKKYISNQDYEDCLFEERTFMHTMQNIQSFKLMFIFLIFRNSICIVLYWM